jgi:hypothetical protein
LYGAFNDDLNDDLNVDLNGDLNGDFIGDCENFRFIPLTFLFSVRRVYRPSDERVFPIICKNKNIA